MEREIANQVAQEMLEKQRALKAKDEERYFDTTNQENLPQRDYT